LSPEALNPKKVRAPLLPLLFALFIAGPAAAADLMSAEKAYGARDYDAAFKAFHELAELGQPTAQFNLAVMYARGEGTRPSDIYAFAWASLAAKNGVEKAKAIMDDIRPKLAPGSEQVAMDIEAQYGNAVLDQHLFPKLASESTDLSERARCHAVSPYFPAYPANAERKGVQGDVYLEFAVPPDGRPRNPHIIYAVPSGEFDGAARTGVLRSEFPTAPPGSKTVECTTFYRFIMRDFRPVTYPELDRLVQKTLEKAEAGDPSAQTLYGMLLVGLPQLNKPRSQGLPWFLKAAQAGVPLAQFQVGFSLLKGWGCDCEENKGLDWLRRAAQAGQPDAEVTLAMYALHGTPDESGVKQARLWLEQAAASGNRDGKLYLAALLAAAPDSQARDPKRALALVEEVFRGVDDDPTAFEIRAAAEASSGQFKEAIKSETKAVSMATRLKWDLAPLNDRLAHYTANQPWYGALVDF